MNIFNYGGTLIFFMVLEQVVLCVKSNSHTCYISFCLRCLHVWLENFNTWKNVLRMNLILIKNKIKTHNYNEEEICNCRRCSYLIKYWTSDLRSSQLAWECFLVHIKTKERCSSRWVKYIDFSFSLTIKKTQNK